MFVFILFWNVDLDAVCVGREERNIPPILNQINGMSNINLFAMKNNAFALIINKNALSLLTIVLKTLLIHIVTFKISKGNFSKGISIQC